MITYREFNASLLEQVKEIYRKESWKAYLQDDGKLMRAFDNSMYLLGAFEGDKLVGFVRCVGDGEHILVVQDLIVEPEHQKQGIGTHLFTAVWEKYEKVRMFLVITDMEDAVDNHFYQSFGMKKLTECHMAGYIR